MADSAGVSCLQHRSRAAYAQLRQIPGVARGLEPPCEVNHDVGTLERPTKIGDAVLSGKVQREPLSAAVHPLSRGNTAHDPEDVVLDGQRAEQSCADIATGPR